MEGLRKSEKFMSEYKLSIFLILVMLAMLFFTAGMKIYYIKNKFYAFNKNGACNQKKTKKLKAAAKYNKNFKKLKKLLGKPKKTKYESYSCYGPGNDGYIKYANFTVYVYKYKGKVLYMGAE